MRRAFVIASLMVNLAVGAEVGTIRGIVMDHGSPVKGATVTMVLRGHSGTVTATQTTVIAIASSHVIGENLTVSDITVKVRKHVNAPPP